MASCEEAKQKNLAVVSGLCWRYDPAVRETMKRMHDGADRRDRGDPGELRHGPYSCASGKPE